ncbi:MAG: hypothetical protein HUU16_20205 [Candidatus Omnitrophica bacterium]|nr:hypothetical protein [bacterium]NUN98489.1 hypothetical protein [Candidatus Omnitrophota bacterium]
MRTRRTPISQSATPIEIGEFWDSHDLSDYWSETAEACFEVNLEGRPSLISLDQELSNGLRARAKKMGMTVGDLLNQWIREKLAS